MAAPIDRLPPERLGIGMESTARSSHTQLFTVQLWLEELGDGQAEWRGKVQNVENGEEHYFRQWAVVGRLLRGMVPRVEDALKAKGAVKAKPIIQSQS